MLTVERFKNVLAGKIINDLIEHSFKLNRCVVDHHLVLHASAFSHDERMIFLRLDSQLFMNTDSSHNKLSCKYFFDKVQSIIEISLIIEVEKLKK